MQRARTEISKENRKQYILDCAEQLILDEGLTSLSLEKKYLKSNLAVGTIYLYFSSKEDIIANLTVKSRQILFDKFTEHANKVQNPLEKIGSHPDSFLLILQRKTILQSARAKPTQGLKKLKS
ncbi:MAG: TetR/AcrR family transcriptional regulator [Emticicia sp.]|nr:TetR/AcrR family transcriptional regulator [Emticicia sp.]